MAIIINDPIKPKKICPQSLKSLFYKEVVQWASHPNRRGGISHIGIAELVDNLAKKFKGGKKIKITAKYHDNLHKESE